MAAVGQPISQVIASLAVGRKVPEDRRNRQTHGAKPSIDRAQSGPERPRPPARSEPDAHAHGDRDPSCSVNVETGAWHC
jgi:hypothetical protein